MEKLYTITIIKISVDIIIYGCIIYTSQRINIQKGGEQMAQKIENAVQPKAWYTALPRPQYATLKKVKEDGWYEVYELPSNIFAIYEPRHFQEVISFLVPGKDKAMLVDTGLGFKPIKPLVESLTDLPVFVVNTHCHFDHIGGNYEFTEGYIFDSQPSRHRMANGLTHDEVKKNLEGDSTWGDYPEGFVPETYHVKPSAGWTFIKDGHVFDLGGRTFKVTSTPGHSPDSIMLADDENKLLFTGDTVYPATLYAHLSAPEGMSSEQSVYRRTMRAVSDAYAGYTILCSHNEPVRPGSMLTDIADAFDAIETGTAEYAVDEGGLKKFQFDGFAIVTL